MSETFPSFHQLAILRNFGRSISSPAYLYRPTHVEQIAQLLRAAAANGFAVGLRGSGRSYGDASLNGGQVALDMRRMNRILEWNPQSGVIRVEPGVTIEQLWKATLEDCWWSPVVPGTMFPTLGGCLAMNIHGKNNYVAGPIGEHVLEFTALLPNGDEVRCTPTENGELFHAMIGGLGVLGVFTSITLQLKKIYSGNVRVHAWASPDLGRMMADMEPIKANADYLVGWVDGTAGGKSLGRGQIHSANYLQPGDDPSPPRSLQYEHQILPDTFFGLLPKSILWQFMRFFMNNPGVWLTNTAKYTLSRTLEHRTAYLQSLVAFNFLLDYVPNWERAYGRGGLIQYQSFVPGANAAAAFSQLLDLSRRRGLPTYLGVLKRHRPDSFLLSHAVDGYSLAMDFKVTDHHRAALLRLTADLNKIVLEAGGRFYFAKDSTLDPHSAAQFLGDDTLRRFRALKAQCDPEGILQTELYRRLFCPRDNL